MSSRNRRRHKIIVDRTLQFGLSLKILAALAVYLLLFCVLVVFGPYVSTLLFGGTEADLISATRRIIGFTENLLIPLFLVFVCLALHSLIITHRIAGPAFRMEQTLRSMEQGDLSLDVNLRDKDYLENIADAYNRMVRPLRQDLLQLRDEADRILEADGDEDQVRRSARSIQALLSRYRISKDDPEPHSESEAVVCESSESRTIAS
jgi:methyl-accepting chemotaxis protein